MVPRRPAVNHGGLALADGGQEVALRAGLSGVTVGTWGSSQVIMQVRSFVRMRMILPSKGVTCIATSLGRSWLHQLGMHAAQGPALQPRDVHLGAADPGCDLVLVQILEEPQHDDLTLQLR
jgi:hypothetical protein